MVDLEDLGRIRENEWFSANEKELIRQAKERKTAQQQQMLAAEEEKLRQLHWMKCPKCGHDLEEVVHEGVKIDECKKCKGIFLDAGELAEILLRSQEANRMLFRKLSHLVFKVSS
ncbi:MAG: zf-TFIIB domain-containing protein [Acidobacteriota bacterium]|nr:zf-TFIIB domain-containing protein [Blastocatellia bacterium]MDW8413311.1 zf-TFIIB domain-containing protein [Acidobacteriota bacterium]